MKFTGGKFKVYKNGVWAQGVPGFADTHLTEREALEKAIALETANPKDVITYKQEEVRVEDTTTPPPVTTPVFDLLKPFKKDAWCYQKLASGAALDPNSPAIVAELALQAKTAANGGTAIYDPSIAFEQYSVPIFYAKEADPKKTVIYSTSNGNKQADIRVPADFQAAGGSDGHAAIFDLVDGRFMDAWRLDAATLKAVHGGVIDGFGASDGTFPSPMGARACGIAATVGVILLEELEAGLHEGVVAIAAARTNKSPKWPANRVDGFAQDGPLVRMGQRFRLPASFVIPDTWPAILKLIAKAARDYGMVVVDTTGSAGSNVNMAYVEDPRPHGKKALDYASYWGDCVKKDAAGNVISLRHWMLGQMFPWTSLEALA